MKIFKYMDFVSMKPEMLFSKKERIKTTYGGLLSAIIVTLGLAAASYFIYEFVSNSRPVVNGSKFFSKNFLRNFNVSSLFLMMAINDGSGNKLENPETIFTPHIVHFNYYYTPKQDPAKDSSTLETYKIKTQKCSEEYINTYYKEKSKDIPGYNGFFCLQPDFNFTVLNPFGNIGNNSYLNIFFTYCNNDTQKEQNSGVICKPLDQIQSILGSYSARLAFFDSYLSHDDFKQPLKPFLNTAVVQGSASRYNRLKVFFQSTEYETDIGWLIYEPNWNYGFNKVTQELTIDDRVESKKYIPQTFFQLTIANDPSGFHEKYLRNYKKIQNIMADIGGFTNVLLIIGTIIALIFSQVEYWQIILRDCSAIINIEEINFDRNIISIKTENPTTNRVVETTSRLPLNVAVKNKKNMPNEKPDKEIEILKLSENHSRKEQNNPSLKSISSEDSRDKNEKPKTGEQNLIKKGKMTIMSEIKYNINSERFEDLKKVSSKIKFLQPKFSNQFKVQLCCCKRSDNDNLVDSINNYHMHVLDVRTVIQLHNEMKTLKQMLMNKNQRKLFEFISNLKNTKEVERYGGDHYDKILQKKEESDPIEELKKDLDGLEETLDDDITSKLLEIYYRKLSEQNEDVHKRRSTRLYENQLQ